MSLGREHGFQRIAFILSAGIAVIGLLLVCIGRSSRLWLAIITLGLTALPWGSFYLARWIALEYIAPQAKAVQPEPAVVDKPSTEPVVPAQPVEPKPILGQWFRQWFP
jgi:hypothetical protein